MLLPGAEREREMKVVVGVRAGGGTGGLASRGAVGGLKGGVF